MKRDFNAEKEDILEVEKRDNDFKEVILKKKEKQDNFLKTILLNGKEGVPHLFKPLTETLNNLGKQSQDMAKDANEVSIKAIEAYQQDLEKTADAEEREKIREKIKAIQEKAYEPAVAREKTIGQLAHMAGIGVLAIVAAVAGSKMDFGSNRNDDQNEQ